MLKCAPIITPDGLRDALELAYDCYRDMEHARRGEDFFRREVDFARTTGAVLGGKLKLWGIADGALRGVAALEDSRLVKYIFVEERYRCRGLGSALVEAMCDWLREEKVGELYAYATRSSAGFFTALGFRPADRAEPEDRWGVEVVEVRLEV